MALTVQPLAENRELDKIRGDLEVNINQPERIGSMIVGGGLIAAGIARRSWGGIALALAGGLLLRRGATGHCDVYERLGINSKALQSEPGVPGNRGIKVIKSVVVNRPPQEVYRYWRNLENLPRFMEHVESVSEIDGNRSHWTVRGPAGTDLEWTAQIVNEREGELLSWESLPGAEVQNAGSVWFEPVNNGTATNVKVSLQYQPPAGVLGAAVAKLFGEAPDQQLENDLERFRQIMDHESAPLSPQA